MLGMNMVMLTCNLVVFLFNYQHYLNNDVIVAGEAGVGSSGGFIANISDG